MASFEIPDAPATVKLTGGAPGAPRTGTAQFTVNNKSDSTMNAQLSLGVQGDAKPEWFSIEGESQRRLETSKSETVNVRISVPATVPAGHYPFRLRVAAVNDPDNDFVDGPATLAEVEQPAEPVVKKGIPWWVWLIVGLVLLGIVGGIIFAVTRKKDPDPQPTETATAATMLTVPNLTNPPKNLSDLPTLAAGFDIVKQPGAVEGAAPDTIKSQNPGPGGAKVPAGSLLKVTFDPGVEVPPLSGQTTDGAIRTLNPTGLFVQNSLTRCETSGEAGQIVDQDPKPGARVAGRTGITVFVRVVNTARVRFGCGVRFDREMIIRMETVQPGILERNRMIMKQR